MHFSSRSKFIFVTDKSAYWTLCLPHLHWVMCVLCQYFESRERWSFLEIMAGSTQQWPFHGSPHRQKWLVRSQRTGAIHRCHLIVFVALFVNVMFSEEVIWMMTDQCRVKSLRTSILAVNWCQKSVEGRLAIGYGDQFHFSGRPHNPTSRFWSSQTSVVTAESFSDRPGPL